jgi:hypothetical protein
MVRQSARIIKIPMAAQPSEIETKNNTDPKSDPKYDLVCENVDTAQNIEQAAPAMKSGKPVRIKTKLAKTSQVISPFGSLKTDWNLPVVRHEAASIKIGTLHPR